LHHKQGENGIPHPINLVSAGLRASEYKRLSAEVWTELAEPCADLTLKDIDWKLPYFCD